MVAPSDAATLFGDSLRHLSQRPATGLTLTLLGLGLALWSMTNAMGTVMSALNVAYDRKDRRGFVRRRLVALAMALFVGGAAVLAGALLIMGPHLQAWLGSALDARGAVATAWSIAQWPVLVAALLFAFSVVLYLGPDVEHRRWQLLTPGAVVAVAVWLAVSWAFSVYTARFGTYDRPREHPRCRDRDADLALARRHLAAVRRRAQRRDRAAWPTEGGARTPQ